MKLLESLPPENLTPQAETELANAIQKNLNDDDSINELVLHNMREGFLYSKRVCRARIADDELFSLCYTTLRRNAKRFRPGQVSFLAFAKAGIRGAISRYWRTLDVVKNSSLHETEVDDSDYRAWRRSERSVALGEGQERGGGMAESNWREKLSEGCGPLLSQLFEDRAEEGSIDADYTGIDTRERMVLVNEIIETKLTPQEAMIISLVYVSGFNFQEIGNLLGITRSAAQLSHAKSLKKIRGGLLRGKRLS